MPRNAAEKENSDALIEGASRPRPAKRAQMRRLRRRVVLCLSLFVVLEGVAALLTSPHFRVRKVRAHGVQNALLVSENESLDRVLKISPKTNWFLAPVGEMERNLKRLAFVRDAKGRHLFPNGLDFQIVVRQPIAAIHLSAGDFEIDSEGIPIRPLRPEVASDLPAVTLGEGLPVALGKPLDTASRAAILRLLKMNEGAPSIRITKIDIDANSDLCLNMSDGVTVKLGITDSTATLDKQIAFLSTLYQRKPAIGTRLATVNLTDPDHPVGIEHGSQAAPASSSAPPALPDTAKDPNAAADEKPEDAPKDRSAPSPQ